MKRVRLHPRPPHDTLRPARPSLWHETVEFVGCVFAGIAFLVAVLLAVPDEEFPEQESGVAPVAVMDGRTGAPQARGMVNSRELMPECEGRNQAEEIAVHRRGVPVGADAGESEPGTT